MSFAVSLSPSPSSSSSNGVNCFNPNPKLLTIQFLSPIRHNYKSLPQLKASRRSIAKSTANSVNDPRNWSRSIENNLLFDDRIDSDDDDDEDEEEDDRSLDLLVRFIENVFKKVSKRARKAVRSVLPVSISTKLVGFSVNGVLILAFLWVLKAFLEVVCTLGSVVFVSILLIRGIWSAITYLQEIRYLQTNEPDGDRHEWTGAQPAM
ncbi:protein SHORT HYPOCOTYL IN WHITE LIGHT 1 [Mercurialis annua]|uniref:protein SHORT HYPOCOTYL IN WHITE LIGHT 1 n=1 Tax=Mercurialis annua TaxID=3986 RepID=UPI00215F9519|nr:protein SHORT HYPOCOTYL IN WHITE LIGHT 1 [Mercurialis annua]